MSAQEATQPVSNVVLITPSVNQIEELANQTIQEVASQIENMEELQQYMGANIKEFKSVHDDDDEYAEYSKFEYFTKDCYEYSDNIANELRGNILPNIKKINEYYLKEIDRLRVLVNKASSDLHLIEQIKFRAAARGIMLGDFTLDTIPPEAGNFYSPDEYLAEIMKYFRQEQEQEKIKNRI